MSKLEHDVKDGAPQTFPIVQKRVLIMVQRRGEECITTVAGFIGELNPLCRALKKKLKCGGTVKTSSKVGEVIQLTGDQRANVKFLLEKKEICRPELIITFETASRSGVVKAFSFAEGLGCIDPNDRGTEVYVRLDSLQASNIRSLAVGGKVEFCTELDEKNRLWAVHVQGPNGSRAVAAAYRKSDKFQLACRSGVVVWFDTEKGFGFVQPDDGGTEVFVHRTAIQGNGLRGLAKGEQVEFQAEADEKHKRVKAVKLTGGNGVDLRPARCNPHVTHPLACRRGIVVWFDPDKGFGCIQPDDGGTEVFVHRTVIQGYGSRGLAKGEQVEFQAVADNKHERLKAVNVTGPDGKDISPDS